MSDKAWPGYRWYRDRGGYLAHLCFSHDAELIPGGLVSAVCTKPPRGMSGLCYSPMGDAREVGPHTPKCSKCADMLTDYGQACYRVRELLAHPSRTCQHGSPAPCAYVEPCPELAEHGYLKECPLITSRRDNPHA